MMDAGFIGLGSWTARVVKNLIDSGYPLRGRNRSAAVSSGVHHHAERVAGLRRRTLRVKQVGYATRTVTLMAAPRRSSPAFHR
jgi:3-hydroxyisobutyrate dehydrogenase-like beta-hydroxyacid dehydrogenase